MKDENVDMARIIMIQTTDDIDFKPNNRNVIDVESTIGGWLYYMRNLVKFDLFTNITCKNCNMMIFYTT